MSGLAAWLAATLASRAMNAGFVNDARRVGAERRRREEGVQVEILPAVAGIDQPAAVTALDVENQPVPVDQQMLGEPLMHLGRRHVHAVRCSAHAPPHVVQTAYRPVWGVPGPAGCVRFFKLSAQIVTS